MANPHALVFDSIAQSNLPVEKKSLIRTWFDKMSGGALTQHLAPTIGYAREGGQVIRQGGESALVGAALALMDHKLGGLDIEIGGREFPIDGMIAAAGFVGALAMANDPGGVAVDARNTASAALAVMTYRKGKPFMAKHTGAAGTLLARSGGTSATPVAHGDEDPIAVAARSL
jgi:hypothetical protein